jgi:hypothetical protein
MPLYQRLPWLSDNMHSKYHIAAHLAACLRYKAALTLVMVALNH